MNQFAPLAQAARIFGFGSGPALRKAFERKLLPQQFLARIGARVLRVDVEGLAAWIKGQQAYPPRDEDKEVGNGE